MMFVKVKLYLHLVLVVCFTSVYVKGSCCRIVLISKEQVGCNMNVNRMLKPVCELWRQRFDPSLVQVSVTCDRVIIGSWAD